METNLEKRTYILISVGANLGNRVEAIANVFESLVGSGILTDAKISGNYRTEPIGYKDQPWFINAAISGFTNYPLFELINLIKSIEYLFGRKRRQHWHEREIDIDVLFYGTECMDTSALTIPHPRMHERKFVLQPASDIAFTAIHPVLNKSVGQLLQECADDSLVLPYHSSN